MVDGAALEKRLGRKAHVGSNPTLSELRGRPRLLRADFFASFLIAILLAGSVSAAEEEVTFSSSGRTLKAYLCRPSGSGPFPVVVYHHGGRGGAIGGAPAQTCKALAEAGFIGFSPVLPTDTTIEENLQDARAALDYAKGLPETDPSRLAVLGFSRGGLLAFLAATERRDLKAVVLMAPAPGKGHLQRALSRVESVSAPVLLQVAENDDAQVDHVQIAQTVHGALESQGESSRLILYPSYGNDGHRMFFEVGSYWSDIVDFLKENLS